LVSCGNALPVGAALTGANANETKGLAAAWGSIAVPRRVGRPRKRPGAVAGDKGYDFGCVRRWFRRQGVRTVIPQRRPHPRHRPRRGRPPGFDPADYRRRNAVERCVGWLKESRRVATRYEKLAVSYLAVIHVAMIRLYLKRVCAALSDRT
jgi:transposase